MRGARWFWVLAAACICVAGITGTVLGLTRADDRVAPSRNAPALTAPLADAPWLVQPNGSPHLDEVPLRESLQFGPGVTYQEALTRLYVSAFEEGRLPDGARLVSPLPRAVVVDRPDGSGAGLTLSMIAPWGYDLDVGTITPPWVEYPDMSSDVAFAANARASREGIAIAPGGRIGVPQLRPCQVSDGAANPAASSCETGGDTR